MDHFAILAHEIRNPLAAIRNAVSILDAHEAPARAVERARMIIDRQLNLITRLVAELLDGARSAIERLEVRKERVDLEKILRMAVEVCQPLIDARGHRLVIRLPPTALYVEADATRLVQVFVNLLENAAKYSDLCGEIVLSVERSGCETLIRVQDKGVGIRPEMLPHVFDQYMRAAQSSCAGRVGLGIGLTLVKHIVKLHGGAVEAHSAGPGSGSLFVVRLPGRPKDPRLSRIASRARPGKALQTGPKKRLQDKEHADDR
jgi:signal transduction histidine kinase